MGKKKIIISQKQLDEICGGNSAYLDNVENDFAQNGNNEVYTGDKLDNHDADPLTTDKLAKTMRRDSSLWGLGRYNKASTPIFLSCSKKEWKEQALNESNSSLEGTNISISPTTERFITGKGAGANAVENGGVSYTNATTIKSRMNKLQKQANAGDVAAQQKYNEMGGEEFHKNIEKTLDDKTSIIQRDKENRSKNLNQQNVFQKPGGKKISGNGQAHSGKGNTYVGQLPDNGIVLN